MRVVTYIMCGLIGGVLWGTVGCGNDNSAKNKAAPDIDVSEKLTAYTTDGSLTEKSDGPENVAGFTILPVGATAFERLSKEQKQTLYNKYRKLRINGRCSAASRDSASADYCRVKQILEQILLRPGGISVDIRHKVKKYLIQLWLHGSNVNRITSKKIRPTFIPGELGAATQLAIRNGADIDVSKAQNVPLDANNIEQLEALLQEIRPYIFETSPEKNSEGSDGVADSATDSVNSGENGPDTEGSEALVVPGASADIADVTAASSAEQLGGVGGVGGVNDVNGDILLYIEDVNFAGILKKLSMKADFLDKKVREVGGTKSTASRGAAPSLVVAHVLHVGGATGPIIEDSQDLFGFGATSLQGDKRILWLNVNEAFANYAGTAMVEEFSATRTMAQLRIERRQLVSVAYHALRQLVGFGADGTENKEAGWLEKRLGDNNQLFEELRADLAALYLCFNQEIRTTGLIPDNNTRNAVLASYLMSALESIAVGVNPKEHPFLMARMVVLNYLIGDGVVTAKASGPGLLSVTVPNFGALRTSLVQLLGKVRNIRFFGDGVKGGELLTQYGYVQAGWTQGLQRRFAKLQIGSRYGVLLPILSKERQPQKKKVKAANVVLTMPRSFYERQMVLAEN